LNSPLLGERARVRGESARLLLFTLIPAVLLTERRSFIPCFLEEEDIS